MDDRGRSTRHVGSGCRVVGILGAGGASAGLSGPARFATGTLPRFDEAVEGAVSVELDGIHGEVKDPKQPQIDATSLPAGTKTTFRLV